MDSLSYRFCDIKRNDYFKYAGHIWKRINSVFGQRVDRITHATGQICFKINTPVEKYEYKR